jgi:hypothetical protein
MTKADVQLAFDRGYAMRSPWRLQHAEEDLVLSWSAGGSVQVSPTL